MPPSVAWGWVFERPAVGGCAASGAVWREAIAHSGAGRVGAGAGAGEGSGQQGGAERDTAAALRDAELRGCNILTHHPPAACCALPSTSATEMPRYIRCSECTSLRTRLSFSYEYKFFCQVGALRPQSSTLHPGHCPFAVPRKEQYNLPVESECLTIPGISHKMMTRSPSHRLQNHGSTRSGMPSATRALMPSLRRCRATPLRLLSRLSIIRVRGPAQGEALSTYLSPLSLSPSLA